MGKEKETSEEELGIKYMRLDNHRVLQRFKFYNEQLGFRSELALKLVCLDAQLDTNGPVQLPQ